MVPRISLGTRGFVGGRNRARIPAGRRSARRSWSGRDHGTVVHRRGRYRLTGDSGSRRRIGRWVRDDLCLGNLLRRNTDSLLRDWLSVAENIFRHCGGRYGSVGIVNIVDVCDVRNICDVSHVPDVRDVYYAQIVATVVIPGKKRLSRSQWKPADQVHADTD
jgi:hypothetical protein